VANGASRCGTGTLVLSASGGNQYRWYDQITGGNLVGTGGNFTTPTLSSTTTFYVSNVNGVTESERVPATATIHVSPIPPIAPEVSRCGPGSITLRAFGGLQYRWYSHPGSNSPLSTQGNYTVNLENTTNFYVTSFDGTCESAPVSVPAIINYGPQIICALPSEVKTSIDTLYSITVIEGNAPYTFEWNFGNGHTISSNISEVTYFYPESGTYSAFVNVTDSNGCESQCTGIIKASSLIHFPPNVFTPNGDDYNETFTINFKGSEGFEMAIYNRWGKLVAITQDGIKGWDGAGCSTGIYFYHIKVANKEFQGWVSLLR
jgi:gliding motility-associated-like protein